jgi:hypothetical protein
LDWCRLIRRRAISGTPRVAHQIRQRLHPPQEVGAARLDLPALRLQAEEHLERFHPEG